MPLVSQLYWKWCWVGEGEWEEHAFYRWVHAEPEFDPTDYGHDNDDTKNDDTKNDDKDDNKDDDEEPKKKVARTEGVP